MSAHYDHYVPNYHKLKVCANLCPNYASIHTKIPTKHRKPPFRPPTPPSVQNARRTVTIGTSIHAPRCGRKRVPTTNVRGTVTGARFLETHKYPSQPIYSQWGVLLYVYNRAGPSLGRRTYRPPDLPFHRFGYAWGRCSESCICVTGEDLDIDDLGGDVMWAEPFCDIEFVHFYDVCLTQELSRGSRYSHLQTVAHGLRYLANSSAGAFRSQLGLPIPQGLAQTSVPVDLTKDGRVVELLSESTAHLLNQEIGNMTCLYNCTIRCVCVPAYRALCMCRHARTDASINHCLLGC